MLISCCQDSTSEDDDDDDAENDIDELPLDFNSSSVLQTLAARRDSAVPRGGAGAGDADEHGYYWAGEIIDWPDVLGIDKDNVPIAAWSGDSGLSTTATAPRSFFSAYADLRQPSFLFSGRR